ncbi:MAG: T9SS type A sorting domain-containing protein [bacterium]|nr:T9SS type A sorting domain-containing protein [bacterium]
MISRHSLILVAILMVLFSVSAPARTPTLFQTNEIDNPVASKGINPAKTQIDSTVIMGPWGSNTSFNGQFQTPTGAPNWNEWTHRDLTLPEGGNHWHVDSYHAANLAGHGPGNLAAWCGSLDFPACSETDPEGGYGNNYDDALAWTVEIEIPNQPSVVTLDAWLNLDLEPGYDYLKLLLLGPDPENDFQVISEYDGLMSNQHLSWEITIPAGEYSGIEGNEIELRFQVTSDGAWSDEDCLFSSAGACQIDDVSVQVDNGNISTFDDFQSGQLGNWIACDPSGRGDFSQIRTHLVEIDECQDNFSPQVCFIDDGIVVPGTGGSQCIDWCYGPGGFIVNPMGGLLPIQGTGDGLHNAVESPIMPWPENAVGGVLEFDVYAHETLDFDSPSIFFNWAVRSTASNNPDDISQGSWQNANFVYYGGPGYRRPLHDLSPYLEDSATFVQVRLEMVQIVGWFWPGENGTPAPYFDNVRVTAIHTEGPRIEVYSRDLAGDSFPASGELDSENLANNSVRFDSHREKTSGNPIFEPRDALEISAFIRGDGVTLNTPRIHYRLIPNPVFDSVRNSGLPNVGSVEGVAVSSQGYFNLDLPDTGFFFPGDIIHYYFSATQSTANGGLETSIVPADTTGFSENPWGANSQQPGLETYNENFIVRALPSLSENFNHPKILVWEDSGQIDVVQTLRHDLNQAQSWNLHRGFDLYRRPYQNSKRTLSADATAEILSGYDAIFYFSGNTQSRILGSSYTESLDVLTQWLQQNNNRGLFISGDQVLTSLNSTAEGTALLTDYLGVEFVSSDLRPLIDNIRYPEVLIDSTQPNYFGNIDSWRLHGFCPSPGIMDAVQTVSGATRIGEFADNNGHGGYFPYSAVSMHTGPNQTLTFSMPYDFQRIMPTAQWTNNGISLRAEILRHLAAPYVGDGLPFVDLSPVPEHLKLSARAYPNPFNPATTISFHLPFKGHLSLEIFNLRGQLVNTLVDEERPAGPGQVLWNGNNMNGSAVASGVYFYRLRHKDEVISEKLMMIK